MIKKIFKSLLWFVVIFVALDVTVIFALPKIVPMEKVAIFVQDQVREQTGRDIAFSSVDFVLWPNIGIELKQVTFSNPSWAQQKTMAALGKADVELELLPLFQRHIVVKKFVLDQPDIYLEISEDGRKSWDFSKDIPALADNGSAAPQHRKSVAAPDERKFDFQFGQMQVNKGKLIFADLEKKTTISVEGIDIDVKWPDPKSPLQVRGNLTYRGKPIALDFELDKPLDFFDGRASAGQVSLKADDFTVKADGSIAPQGTLLKGDMDVTVPSLAEALAWAQGTQEQRKLPFEKLTFTGAARLSKSDIILKEATLSLDDMQAKGDLNVGFVGRPEIFARLSVNKLNLDRFTGSGAAAASGAFAEKKSDAPAESSASGDGGWDAKPLDFSGLKAVNADLTLKTEGFTLRGVEVGPSLLTVQVQDGDLHFKSSEASLFGGKFSSELGLNVAKESPAISFSFNMAGVDAQPVLATFAHFKKLSGTVTGHAAITAYGDNQKAIISSLAGNGSLDFKNGALEGIDMVKIAQLVQDHSTDVGVSDGATKFVDMTGTFTMARGVASNTDLKMRGLVLQASGQGTVDFPKKYVQYRVTPILVTSAAADSAPGLSVPVIIKGPFNGIKVIPDFASTVKDIVKNPSAAKSTLKNIRDNFKKNPAAALQDLLGGVLGKKSAPAPETAPAPQATPEAMPAPDAASVPDAAPAPAPDTEQQPQAQPAP